MRKERSNGSGSPLLLFGPTPDVTTLMSDRR